MITPATAADLGSEVPGEKSMSIAGFDADVARAHGYEVVTLPDGAVASVPAEKAEAARLGKYIPRSGVIPPPAGGVSTSAYGETVGDCGLSWVQISPRGGAKASLTTGMTLVPDSGGPWDVHWWVDVADTGGYSTQPYTEYDGYYSSIGLSWTAKARSLNLTRGWANVTVTFGSFTITEAGWICYSYSPTASTTIT
ncbi:hypothetical protein Aph02nite_64330 [Actinoplanes philippinensis]|nr:hypothetical protein [Actinoplanes philippinensis]GIE80483.1 hypothetical protein Aph02nite_64330 [Actinoplanes philippinensis]